MNDVPIADESEMPAAMMLLAMSVVSANAEVAPLRNVTPPAIPAAVMVPAPTVVNAVVMGFPVAPFTYDGVTDVFRNWTVGDAWVPPMVPKNVPTDHGGMTLTADHVMPVPAVIVCGNAVELRRRTVNVAPITNAPPRA